MKIKRFSKKPDDLTSRVGAKPVICYPNDGLNNSLKILHKARQNLKKNNEVIIPPRDAKTFEVKSGNFFVLKV